MTQNNILLITTDQQRWDHLGLAGIKGIQTPNLDRLGTEGIHISKAYCPSPTCTPSRVSLLTGQYPSSHGAYSIGVSVDPFPSVTVPGELSKAGYHTALMGKTHFVRRDDEERHMSGMTQTPPEFWRNWSGPYVGFDEIKTSSGHTTNADPNQHYRVFLEDQGVDWRPWFPLSRGERPWPYTPGAWDIPAKYHDTEWVTQMTEQFIDQRSEEDKPWFCWTSYQDPHLPFLCPEPWFSSVDMSEVELFEGKREDEFNDKPDVYEDIYRSGAHHTKYNTDGCGLAAAYGSGNDKERLRAELQATLGMLAFIDHGVGRIIKRLEEKGMLENTLIVFTTDHGEYHGHHGFTAKGIPAYDDAQRVPLLLRGPGVKAQGTVGALANLVDLPKTFLDIAGCEIPQGMQGVTLCPLLSGEKQRVQDSVLVECRPNENGIYQQTFITNRYKLVIYRDQNAGELYDMQADPDQYENLWSSDTHAQIKLELMQAFLQFNMRKDGRVNSRLSFG